MKRSFYSLLILLPFFIFSGCKKDEAPTAPQNHLPKIESLTANPTTVLISTETTLTCIATDEDGDNLTITWSSKRGTFSNGVVGVAVKWVSPSTAGKDTITATVNDGKQTIQGKLEIIVGTIPASPTLVAPANNATEVALSPTLTWNAVSNAVSYTLQVSTSNSFSSFVYNQSGLTNTSQQISSLNHTSTYYWRVNSTNIYGISGWSNIFSFKTLAPPQAPTLLTPTNNATEVALSPTLTWNALSNAVSYTLQISTSSSFTSFVFNQTNLINPSQQISGLNYFTKYYWRVNATNTYGTSGWSSTWSFTAIGIAPQAPVLLTPINSAVNISLTPLLNWNGSTYATSYTLQVSTNSSFTNFTYNQSGLATTNKPISGLNNWTKYYWRVNAINSYGTSGWSETWSFTTILAAPTLSLPVNGTISIPISPTLSWNAVSGATNYSLQVSTSSSFSTFAYNQSGFSNTSQQISGLNYFTTYYWRVNATNNFGISDWSTYRTFQTISGPCQGIPTVSYAGKTYNTVQIEKQCWLKESLDVGTMIQVSQNASDNSTIEKYCYNNDLNNCATYGGLYQWSEAMVYSKKIGAKGICPDGWHIPTLPEFQTLGTIVNNNSNALKEIGQGYGNGIGTNISGFSALLSGNRRAEGYFSANSTYFWSSSELEATTAGGGLGLVRDDSSISFLNANKEDGFGIRCIKD